MTKKILHVENSAWDIYNFRLPHIKKLRSKGFEVVIVSPIDEYFGYLNEHHYTRHIQLKYLRAQAKNPLFDLLFFFELLAIYRREHPCLTIQFTIKPAIFGSIAARLAGIPAISILTGLGYTFVHRKGLLLFIPWLCKLAFRKLQSLVLYNSDDIETIVNQRILPRDKCRLLHGSGVNTNHFRPFPTSRNESKFVFLFIGRILYDKGLAEFVQAARKLEELGKPAECWVVGNFNYTNPSAVPKHQLMDWVTKRNIRYFGATDDVRQFIKEADILVLPAYGGEGIPRVILEAMAMGKPIITTTTAGCRETIQHDETGLLIPPRDASALLEAMLYFLEMPQNELQKMGEKCRRRVLENFDEKAIAARYLDIIQEVVTANQPSLARAKHPAVF